MCERERERERERGGESLAISLTGVGNVGGSHYPADLFH